MIVEQNLAPAGAVVIVDGLFLHRDELAGAWDFSLFLDVAFDVTVRRLAQRDGSQPDPGHPSMGRYVQGQKLYSTECARQRRASLTIDNPRIGASVLIGR